MEQETVVAMTYEVLSCLLVRGVDLFALDALIATYCQFDFCMDGYVYRLVDDLP